MKWFVIVRACVYLLSKPSVRVFFLCAWHYHCDVPGYISVWLKLWYGENLRMCRLIVIKPSPAEGGLMQPPWFFLSWTLHRLEYRTEIVHSLWGVFCATLSENKLVRSG